MDLLRDKPDWKVFHRRDVQDVDAIIRKAQGRGTTINYSSEKDWDVVRIIVKIVNRKYPGEIARYITANKELMETRQRDTGASKSMGTRFLVNMPNLIITLIRSVYRDQKFDVKFFREFAKHFSEFRVARKI